MLRIEPQKSTDKVIDTKQLQRGEFKTIVILSEKDLEFLDILCGVTCELLIVPRKLTKKEEEIFSQALYIDHDKKGKIIVL